MMRPLGWILLLSFAALPARAETDYTLRLKTPFKIGMAPQLLDWPAERQNFARVDGPDGKLQYMCTDAPTTEEMAARLLTLREYPAACQSVIDASMDELYGRCNAALAERAPYRYTLLDVILASSAAGGVLLVVGLIAGGIAF